MLGSVVASVVVLFIGIIIGTLVRPVLVFIDFLEKGAGR